jgi:hypothetical protein
MKHIFKFFSTMIAYGLLIILGLWAGDSGIIEKLDKYINSMKEKLFKGGIV